MTDQNKTITMECFKAHAQKLIDWLDKRKPIDREEYYWLADNLSALIVNNLPKEFE